MRNRLRASLVIVGLALLSATPAAPEVMRHLDLLTVHLFRPLDAALAALRDNAAATPAAHPSDPYRERVVAGELERNRLLLAGAARVAPGRSALVARIVAVDWRNRRLLIDAGAGVELSPGDAVLAGHVGVGRVKSSQNGVAVVETPFTPDARFTAACQGGGDRAVIRFILTGLARREWAAAVTNPEKPSGLKEGLEVFTPRIGDLVSESIPTLPAGLRWGELTKDLELERAGREAYCTIPAVSLAELDAVAVLPARPPPERPDPTVGVKTVDCLSCGLASSWRDGGNVFGRGLPVGGAVTLEGWFAGTIEAAQFGAARVRGVFDPGQTALLLVVGSTETFPLRVRATKAWIHGGRMELAGGSRLPEIGDLLVTAGRGAHVHRGLKVGTVVQVGAGWFDVTRPVLARNPVVEVYVRLGYPDGPWGN